MKNVLYVTILLLAGCGVRAVADHVLDATTVYNGNNLVLSEVGGCEYVIFVGSQKGGIVHHHNCKYCKKRDGK